MLLLHTHAANTHSHAADSHSRVAGAGQVCNPRFPSQVRAAAVRTSRQPTAGSGCIELIDGVQAPARLR